MNEIFTHRLSSMETFERKSQFAKKCIEKRHDDPFAFLFHVPLVRSI